MMKFDFKPHQFFFRNKDLVQKTLENLNPIEMQAVARTSKTFNIATQNAQYDCGLVLFPSGYLESENPKIFLESEFNFRELGIAVGSKIIDCPVLRGSNILPFINTIVIIPFPSPSEEDVSIFEEEETYRIHPLLLEDDVHFPEIDSIFLDFSEVGPRDIQNLDALSRHTRMATTISVRGDMDPELWELLNLTKIVSFELSTANWYGTFRLPENPNEYPALQYLDIEIFDFSGQEVDLSRLNSFPQIIALSLDIQAEGDGFLEALTLPNIIENLHYLCIGTLSNEPFSLTYKNKIQELVYMIPNLKVLASNQLQDFQMDLPHGCEMKIDVEFCDIIDSVLSRT